ncbi:MAG: bifunctional demethylmenaquinone methyltransferase/2-methoxy-6-polyprenyl-1,4-benzoquinol methylase UbiE [Rikenellaceae bacterium]|jgi:demethylmenaquinone methyltransferase/2-methoxy-6-polyprenyl-1,4-benzoquinol methylase|nr:bifunctional demethylmenaquinone methyltransferase/2-methoxy-6-polyprenyl-1,4-benzoquinol methylase UbiE [Rikenellaceae bacterium]
MKPYQTDEGKEGQVQRMFDGIAPHYDLLNRLLSLGIDRGWRRKAVRAVVRFLGVSSNSNILDVATGTGDMAVALARAVPGSQVVGVDISEGMLEVGRKKVARAGLSDRITLSQGDTAGLGSDEQKFDAATAAFGVRNFEDLAAGIAGMHRALRPGGMIAVLEFSTPRNRLFGAMYRLYFHRVLPLVGGWISGDAKAYRYLPGSVDEFPAPPYFVALLEHTGFTDCRARSLTGGVAYLYTGIKKG